MDRDSRSQHLSWISTLWTLLHQAHGGAADVVPEAQRLLLQRYSGAVYFYLLGAVRDEEAAKELCQEFFLRFVRGDFRRADPEKGRFRDYLKTALINLVNKHHTAQRARPSPLPADLPSPEPLTPLEGPEADFLSNWREELLNRTWDALREAQPTYHAVLLSHVEQPDMPSPERAEELSARLGKPISAGNVRVSLHRAREKFADLLLDEVAHSLESPGKPELLQELRELDLLKYCGPALDRRDRQ